METTAKAWQCELSDCGRVWLAKDSTPPRICPGCKKTGWHKTASTQELVREATLDERIQKMVEIVLSERLPNLLAELRESMPTSVTGWTDTVAPSPLVLPIEDRRAAALASLAGLGVTTAARMDDHPEELRGADVAPVNHEPDNFNPCPYKDPPNPAGDIIGCSLHLGHKGPHKPGPKVGDIW